MFIALPSSRRVKRPNSHIKTLGTNLKPYWRYPSTRWSFNTRFRSPVGRSALSKTPSQSPWPSHPSKTGRPSSSRSWRRRNDVRPLRKLDLNGDPCCLTRKSRLPTVMASLGGRILLERRPKLGEASLQRWENWRSWHSVRDSGTSGLTREGPENSH